MRDYLRAGRGFTGLYVALLGLGMSLVIFLGSIMGDCGAGTDCHANDGAQIARALMFAAPIVLGFGAVAWPILAAINFMLRGEGLSPRPRNLLLTAATLIAVLFSLSPAFDMLFWWESAGRMP